MAVTNVVDDLIRRRKARVGVVGLGYVGLPLACAFAEAGFRVTGFETDPAKLNSLKKGLSYIQDVPEASLRALVRSGRLATAAGPADMSRQDAVVICVPTPLRKSKDPDMSYIRTAVEALAPRLRRGQLVVLESTTYPGTTREMVMPLLEVRGLKAGRDFHLAFSPERVDPGNRRHTLRNTPKIVGGITPACGRAAEALYAAVAERVVTVSSAEAAEMAKLLENTFRAVNIGLANEVALMCDRLGLDVWEVIDAAATKPFGFMPFYPGPGIGGHCIPLDPQYLSWKLKTLNFYSRFIELAEEVNSRMPEHVVEKAALALNGRGKALNGARVLVLGAAYKRDVGDVRESPALHVMEGLRARGARVAFHDPYVEKVRLEGAVLRRSRLTPALLRGQDCVVVATDHGAYDMRDIVKSSALVVDARNATKGFKDPKIVRL